MFRKSLFFAYSAFVCLAKAKYPAVELPDPHLVIISTLDVDSTSLANVLLGGAPDCKDCLTDVCTNDTLTPCTTKFAVGEWVGSSTNVSLLQASSFGEPGGYMKVKNTVDIFKTFLKTNNRFLIVLNSSIHRTEGIFDTNLDQILSHMGALFGRDFWSRVVLGATDWHYDTDSVMGRNQSGKNEAWWSDMMSSTIQQRFDSNGNFSTVFIDADAMLPDNMDDPLQGQAFIDETEKLLLLMSNTLSEELTTLQEQNDDLNNIINNTLTNMQEQLNQLTTDMSQVQDDVIDNGIDISYVEGIVALNQIDIEKQDKRITENDFHMNEINGNITAICPSLYESNFITKLIRAQGFECIGDSVITIPGNITSANYPHNFPSSYNPATECTFSLVPQPGLSVRLEWIYFQTPDSSNYLQITPHGDETLQFSGSSIPPNSTYGVGQNVNVRLYAYNTHMYDYDAIYNFIATFTMI